MVFFQNASLHEELFEMIQSDTLEACLLPTLMSATTNTRGRRDGLQTNSCTYIQTDFRQGAIFRGVHRLALRLAPRHRARHRSAPSRKHVCLVFVELVLLKFVEKRSPDLLLVYID